MKKIDLRKLAFMPETPDHEYRFIMILDEKNVGDVLLRIDPMELLPEVVSRYNGYLDLVAAADNLAVVIEDTGGEARGLAAPLRKLLEDQGWDADSLSKLLDAREEGESENNKCRKILADFGATSNKKTLWIGGVDGKWGVWDKSPMTKGAKLLVPATNQEDAENKRNALERFKLEPGAFAQPALLPFTVVLRSYSTLNGSDDHTWYCEAATDPTDAENQAIAALKGEDDEPEYTAIAIYAGHLTNLIQ